MEFIKLKLRLFHKKIKKVLNEVMLNFERNQKDNNSGFTKKNDVNSNIEENFFSNKGNSNNN